MKVITPALRLLAGGALTLAVLIAPARAQSPAGDEWRFRATVYGWFPGISGTTEFPSGAGGPSLGVDANTLISHLKMAFMGTFEAESGKWGALVDWFYADIGGDKSGTRDFSIHGQPLAAGVTANLSLDVKTNILTLAGTYSLVEQPASSMKLVFGARMLSIDQTLNWTFSGTAPRGIAVAGTTQISPNNWDGIIGVGGRARFGNDLRWFVPYYADVGAGNSKFTWQAILGVGYSFGWGDAIAAWRYLDYEFKSGEPIQSIAFNGVAVGVSFRF